jgi:hypothetical protein
MSNEYSPQVIRSWRNRERNGIAEQTAFELDGTSQTSDTLDTDPDTRKHGNTATLAMVRVEEHLGYFSTR